MRRLSAAAAVLMVVLAGCGGPIEDDELERGIDTLGSLAAEGQLVARGVAEDRTKVTFVRVELRDLSDDAEHEAEKLSDAQDGNGNADVKEQAIALAGDIDDALGRLQVEPRNRALARDVGQRLSKLADDAEKLGERL